MKFLVATPMRQTRLEGGDCNAIVIVSDATPINVQTETIETISGAIVVALVASCTLVTYIVCAFTVTVSELVHCLFVFYYQDFLMRRRLDSEFRDVFKVLIMPTFFAIPN